MFSPKSPPGILFSVYIINKLSMKVLFKDKRLFFFSIYIYIYIKGNRKKIMNYVNLS